MADDEQPMAWGEFSAEFDHKPNDQVVIAYLKGMRACLPRLALNVAIAVGAATEIPTPKKADADRYKADPYWRPADETPAGDPPKA